MNSRRASTSTEDEAWVSSSIRAIPLKQGAGPIPVPTGSRLHQDDGTVPVHVVHNPYRRGAYPDSATQSCAPASPRCTGRNMAWGACSMLMEREARRWASGAHAVGADHGMA